MSYRDKTVLIYDYGLFVSWAEKLTEYFGRVLYYMPWKSAFPKSNTLIVGKGLNGVERVRNFFDHVDEVDLFVFSDVYDGDLQEHLRSLGKRVWGGGKGEIMELDRWWMKQKMKEIQMPVQDVWKITGLAALRDFLKEHNNKFIKVSATRGDFETFKHENYDLSEPKLDELEWKLGAKKHFLEFIVEDEIPDAIEVGYDGWSIDGRFAEADAFMGIEIKDLSFAGAIMDYDKLPDSVKWVNAKFSPILESFGYRGFMSTELRIPESGDPYMIDFCARAGSPPNELYQEIYSNWDDILWEGADGSIVDPLAIARYGVLAMIHSQWADKNWQSLHYPQEISRWVKIRNKCVIGDMVYVAPQESGLPEIGAVIGIGDTLREAVHHLIFNARQIRGYTVEIKLDSISLALQEAQKGIENGVLVFGDSEIPTSEEIANMLNEKEETERTAAQANAG